MICFCLSATCKCQQPDNNSEILFGADILISENLDLLKNKNAGLIINQTSLLKNGTPLLDSLTKLGINVKAIFSPEHGFKGQNMAGELIEDFVDPLTGVKVYSIYGTVKKPTPEMLKEIDLLIFDIQDIGTRFYTYISTLYYVIEAAAENNIPVIVADRPNPLSGLRVEGPVLEEKFKSFIGIAEIPVLHGMTIGELANLFNEEIKKSGNGADLTVVKMNGWKRNFDWEDINHDWVSTSPNIPDFETAQIYPATCLLEGTNVSEGRGTENPFKIIGAPFINSDELISTLNNFNINGIQVSAISFVPTDLPGKASDPKFEHEQCNGIKIQITDKEKFYAIDFGIKLICALYQLYPKEFQFRTDHFDKLIGSDYVREMINNGIHPDSIINSWQKKLDQFKEKRKTYLLY